MHLLMFSLYDTLGSKVYPKIEPRMLLVLKSYKWRRVVVRLPPELDLVFTVNFGGLMFAEAF